MRDPATPDPDLATVTECSDLMEAEMVRGLLETHGLTPRVVSRDQWVGKTAILGVRNLRGLQVAVPPHELHAAREILKEVKERNGDLELDEDAFEVERCPNCDATEVYREVVSGRVVVMIALATFVMLYLLLRSLSPFNVLLFGVCLVFAVIILLGKDTWRCRACGHRWNE